jgi:hypothetical protein
MGTNGNNEGVQRKISPATEAALWTLSNGKCYAPGCLMPVVVEVKPGVYRKNVQVAHIYGVKPNARRYRHGMGSHRRDSFAYLLLLCVPHHSAVDDPQTGEQEYPPELLLEWKARHEGGDHEQLNRVTIQSDDALLAKLESVFEPPLQRLENLADHLEQTGEANERSVSELRRIISILTDNPLSVNERVARELAVSADILSSMNLRKVSHDLLVAAEMLANSRRRGEY